MIEINLTPEQLAALGLSEGEVTSEAFMTALDAILAKAAGGEEHGQQITDLTAKLDAAEHRAAALDAKVAELNGTLAEIEKAKTMAEVDALLSDYEMPEASAAAMRELAISNRDQATALLGAMPKKAKAGDAAAEGEKKPDAAEKKPDAGSPPPPVHEPGNAEMTPEKKASEASALIAEIRKGGRFPSFEAAREEARRRKPELFS